MSEANKAVVHRIIDEVWNNRNRQAIDETYGADLVIDTSDGELRGPDGYRELYDRYTTAFPDAHLVIENMVAEDDSVASAYVFTGTHQGDLMGIPPTGKQVTVKGTTIMRFADGKCVAERTVWDTASTNGRSLRRVGVTDSSYHTRTQIYLVGIV